MIKLLDVEFIHLSNFYYQIIRFDEVKELCEPSVTLLLFLFTSLLYRIFIILCKEALYAKNVIH